MPREDRRITFSNTELQEALVAHGLRRRSELPHGQIISVAASSNADGEIMVTLFDDRKNKTYNLALQPEFVAAALIYYCKGVGVPVPRRAAKSLSIAGDNVTLQIALPEYAERRAFVIQALDTNGE